MLKSQPTAAAFDLITAVSAAGVDDSVQACFSDALKALEGFSFSGEKEASSEQQSPATSTQAQNGGSAQSQGVLDGSKEELQRRMVQAATILRKLCAQKSRLEARVRELEQAETGVSREVSDVFSQAPSLLCGSSSSIHAASLTSSEGGSKPANVASDALHRKDAVINQLQAALRSTQRQVALLRGAQSGNKNASLEHNAASNLASGRRPGQAGKLMEREASDSKRLKKLQQDYRQLLDSKISGLHGRADRCTVQLLERTRARLDVCMEERDTQERLLNERLAALENAQLDWYVEKRLMQEEHAALRQAHERLQAHARELETLAATAAD
eukprot:jgi/Ulvmu1/9376/UM051_0003.1